MKKIVLLFILITTTTLLPLGKAYSQDPGDWFITVWKSDNPSTRTGNTNTSIAFPGIGTNYTLKWENVNNTAQSGIVTVPSSSAASPYILNVPAVGTYRIYAHSGSGSFTGFIHQVSPTINDPKKLLRVEQWGNTVWGTTGLVNAFRACHNMDVTATDAPNFISGTSLFHTFSSCWNLKNTNGSIGRWNTTNVTNMSSMFDSAVNFNQPLTGWNTANVTLMNYMFAGASKFNQPLSHFDVSKVTQMRSMFWKATAFNQNIDNWNTAKVTNMSEMFNGATTFDQSLTGLELNEVTNMSNIIDGSGIGCQNLSLTLDGWKNQAVALNKTGIGIGALPNEYNATGQAALTTLENTYNWTYTGGSLNTYCAVVWTGSTDSNWDSATNWKLGKVATDGNSVEFATAANNNGVPAANDLHVSGDRTIKLLINESNKRLVVPVGTSLTVTDTVKGSATLDKADKIHIQSNATDNNGSLILAGQPTTDPVYATVYMVVKSGKLSTPTTWNDNITGSPTNGQPQTVNYTWQYFGVPVEQVKADDTFYGTYLREYSEPTNAPNNFYGKWKNLYNYSTLSAFKGYEVSQERPHGSNPIYWIKGQLVHGDRTLTLTRQASAVAGATGNNVHYGLGQNIFGNSYTAAIAIDSIVFPPEVEQTVYLYRTGSLADWGVATTDTTGLGWVEGGYLAIPAKVSSVLNNGHIPSMQGFLLRFTDAETTHGAPDATVTIRYGNNRVVPNTKPQMAPAYNGANGSGNDDNDGSNSNNGGLSYMQVTLGSRTTTDNLWLFEQEGTSERFDNGWDGRKYFGTPASFIYVQSPDGELQVSTGSTLDGTLITHYANRDTAYTLTLTRHNMPAESNPLYLIDLVERTYTPLNADTVRYAFTVQAHNVAVKRFMLARQKPGDELTGSDTATELLDLYFTPDGEVVLNNFTKEDGTATLYDVSGRVAGRYTAPVGTSRISIKHLPAGVYFATVEASAQRKTEKGVISSGQ